MEMTSEEASRLEQCTQEAVDLAESGDYETAANLFREAIACSPTKAALHEQLSQCLSERGEYAEACTAAEASIELEPQWPEAWRTLARVEANLGNFGRSLQAYSACLDLAVTTDKHAIQQEKQETEGLWQKQMAARIGQPRLRIVQGVGQGQEQWSGKAASVLQSICPGITPVRFPSQLAVFWHSLKHRERLRGWLRGKLVLELGSGTGIAGITAALCGAKVTLTDTEQLQQLLALNMQRNGVEGAPLVLDWDCPQFSELGSKTFDALLCADVVYSHTQVAGVANAVREVVSRNPGCRVYVAHKSRNALVDTLMFDSLTAAGCELQKVGVSCLDRQVNVYQSLQTSNHDSECGECKG